MPYSDIDLDTRKMLKLRTAFLNFSCIKNDTNLDFLIGELCGKYQEISIEKCEIPTRIGKLIRKCQDYEGALEELIDLMEALFEKESVPMKKLRETLEQIFSPPPPNPASLLQEGDCLVICVNASDRYLIPLKFAELGKDEIKGAKNLLYTWKKIHTLCEKLAKDYGSSNILTQIV